MEEPGKERSAHLIRLRQLFSSRNDSLTGSQSAIVFESGFRVGIVSPLSASQESNNPRKEKGRFLQTSHNQAGERDKSLREPYRPEHTSCPRSFHGFGLFL